MIKKIIINIKINMNIINMDININMNISININITRIKMNGIMNVYINYMNYTYLDLIKNLIINPTINHKFY
jgi:hypothetical protein